MKASSRSAVAVALLLAASLLVGCSDSGDSKDETSVSAEEQPYVDAMVKTMSTADEDGFKIEKEQATCIASRVVDAVGIDAIKKANVKPSDMSTDDGLLKGVKLNDKQGNEVFDSFKKCDADIRQMMLDSMSEDEETPQTVKDCFSKVMTDDVMRTFVVSALVSGDSESPESQAALAPLIGCAFMGLGDQGSSTTEAGN